jgi:hypothetical protein
MRIIFFHACFLMLVLAGCATPALWDHTNPNMFVSLSDPNITTNELAARGIDYKVSKLDGSIYIQKSQLQKFGDYTLRVLATPVTVALDVVAGTTIICGAMLLEGATHQWKGNVIERPDDPTPVKVF